MESIDYHEKGQILHFKKEKNSMKLNYFCLRYLGSDEPLLLLDVEPPLQPPGQGQEEEEEAGRAEEGGLRAEEGGHGATWAVCNTQQKC